MTTNKGHLLSIKHNRNGDSTIDQKYIVNNIRKICISVSEGIVNICNKLVKVLC